MYLTFHFILSIVCDCVCDVDLYLFWCVWQGWWCNGYLNCCPFLGLYLAPCVCVCVCIDYSWSFRVVCLLLLFTSHPTPQVLPQPLYVVYRVVVFIYMAVWIWYDGFEEGDGGKYLIYFTIWGYILLLTGLLATLIASIAYMVVSYAKPHLLNKRLPQKLFLQPQSQYYRQDRLPWFLKIVWVLYILAVVPTLPIIAVYWIIEESPRLTAEGLHLHGINLLVAVMDILISRIPIHLLHFYIPMTLGVVYTAFLVIFWAAGGTNARDGGRYVYMSFNFSESPGRSIGFCILLILAAAAIHAVFFGIAQVRDQFAKRLSWCFWNVPCDEHDVDEPLDSLRETWLVHYAPTHSSGGHVLSKTPDLSTCPNGDKMAAEGLHSSSGTHMSPETSECHV